ncbi:MAG: hypothetical protein ACREMO_00220 [Gemmatimonadales bacterium]
MTLPWAAVVGELGLACALAGPAAGQSDPQPELPPLEFLGFRPGENLLEVDRHVSQLGGAALRCRRARTDPSVLECRATLADSAGRLVAVWLSAMDSAVAVLTLSGAATADRLDDWQARLDRGYGRVGTRVQGAQRMMQWVRRGRMIRLTWRLDRGARIASVSLVDGWVLDRWGRRRGEGGKPAATGE